MRIVLLDDEILSLELLEDTIREVIPYAEIILFNSTTQFLEDLDNLMADVYFLDIQMSNHSGIDVAKKIKEKNEHSNLVFVTGYDNYKADAMDLYASAYLLKPVSVQIVREAFSHLRYNIHKELKAKPFVQTFGIFTFFVDGLAITFHRRKSKELLAYLISRRGEIVSRQQLTYILYEDESHSRNSQKKLHTVYKALYSDLELVSAEHILRNQPEGLSIDANAITCDLYEYLDGNSSLYDGYYMEDYAWGEQFKGCQWGCQWGRS